MFLSVQGFVQFGIAGGFCLGPAIGGGLQQVRMLSVGNVASMWDMKIFVLLVPHIKQCFCKESVYYGRFKAIPNIEVCRYCGPL